MAGPSASCQAAVLLTLLAMASAAETIHRHMSKQDLRNVFHVDRHEDVPEYQVVKVVGVRQEPGKQVVRIRAFGQDLELSLESVHSLFKNKLRLWAADYNNSAVQYTEIPHEHVGEAYQDEKSQAALVLHKDPSDGTLLLEGTIGHNLVLKPVPASVRQHLDAVPRPKEVEEEADDEMLLEEGEEAVAAGFPLGHTVHHRHIVYRRGVPDTAELGDYAFMEPDDLPQKFRRKRSAISREKRDAPYVIYPEILVIVDYDGYRLHGGDNVQIKRYFVSFWNGVDLRYKLLKGPKIRISIAGIIISRGRDATPYLERNRVGRDAIDSAAALTDMGKYLFRERRLPVYDIAVAVTKLDMCRRQYPNEACNRGTAGFAYVGGACVVNKRLEKVNSVAIIEDTGGFSGIIVAAHEVGHLLGAVHDGSPPPTYLGGPGAEKCRWEDGFIMSDLRHTEKGFKWSLCSVASFHHFLNGDTATCLFNSPHEDESLPRVLPGKLLTLDAQCRKDRGTSACFKDERVCAQLFCFDAASGYCVAYRPAAEGSPCGDGQYCTNGKCTAEHENIIPDYSQNTPSYLRRSDSDMAATQTRSVYANITTQRSPWEDFWRTASTTAAPEHYNQYTTALVKTTKSYQTSSTFVFDYSTMPGPNYGFVNNDLQSIATPKPNNLEDINLNYKYKTIKPSPVHSTTQNPYTQLYQKSFLTTESHGNHNAQRVTNQANGIRKQNNSFNFKFGQTLTTSNPYEEYNKQFYFKRPALESTSKATPTTKYYGVSPTLSAGTTKNIYEEYNKRFYTSSHFAYQSTTVRPSPAQNQLNKEADATSCVDKATNMSGSMSCYEFLTRYGYHYCGTAYIRNNCCAAQKYLCQGHAGRRR